MALKVWSFVSQKGGTGKSVLSTQLAVRAQETGERCALIDIDPQASATGWGKLRGDRKPEVIPALPSDLRQMIDAAPTMGYTLLLIDTAPHTRADTVDAINVATTILCPTRAAPFEQMALGNTAGVLDLCGRASDAIGIVNGLRPVKTAALQREYEEAASFLKGMGMKVAASFVCHREDIEDALREGRGVTETAKTSKAAGEIRDLYDELKLLQPNNVVRLRKAK